MPGYIICRAQCKVKVHSPLLKSSKTFNTRMMTSEHLIELNTGPWVTPGTRLTHQNFLVLGSHAGVFLSLESVLCLMVHYFWWWSIMPDTRRRRGMSLKLHSGIFQSGLIATSQSSAICHTDSVVVRMVHCYFLPPSTFLSFLQLSLYSLPSVLVWFIMLWQRLLFLHFHLQLLFQMKPTLLCIVASDLCKVAATLYN